MNRIVFDCECYRDYFLVMFRSIATGKTYHYEMYEGKEFNARVKEAPTWGREFLFAEPNFDGKEDFEAGAAFFGITVDDSYYIFGPDEYNATKVTPKAVIKRIKEILNDSKAVAA